MCENVYQINRNDLYKRIADSSLTLLYSGALKQSSADENYPFKVNANFYYLTGIDQDNVYVCLIKIRGEVQEHLFIEENTDFHTKWMGAYLTKDEAKQISNIAEIHYLSEFETFINKNVSRKGIKTIYLDQEISSFKGQIDFGKVLKNKINAICFDKKIEDIYGTIVKLRGVKKPYEISLFKKADEITKLALEKVMQEVKYLDYEYQVQGVFEGEIRKLGNSNISFETIAASGQNAAILHYRANNAKMDKQGMILLDLGAEYGKYHADVSRTYPLSGHFQGLGKKIYEIVLACNKYIISLIEPGITIRYLQNETISFLANACLEEGLISTREEISNYYFHGISHHIGLDTHDPFPRNEGELVPGMIISCEPGLYFANLGIGVRIEDDILVTEDGNVNLTKDIIKEVDDIEAYMAKF